MEGRSNSGFTAPLTRLVVTQGTRSRTTAETAAARRAAFQFSLFSLVYVLRTNSCIYKSICEEAFLAGCILNVRNILGCFIMFKNLSNLKCTSIWILLEVINRSRLGGNLTKDIWIILGGQGSVISQRPCWLHLVSAPFTRLGRKCALYIRDNWK